MHKTLSRCCWYLEKDQSTWLSQVQQL